jgi:formylglycine-generating enzyme required for sulfatase activity
MKAINLTILLALIYAQTFPNEFELRSFQRNPNDLTARVNERKDINDQSCAVIKVYTDVPGLRFNANLGIEGNVAYSDGVYTIYVSPGERRLQIYAEGFLPFVFNIPERIESLMVYDLYLVSLKEPQVQTLPVAIRFTPDDAELYINDEPREKSLTYSLALGQHSLRIVKEGFQPIEETITVNEQNIFFEYTLQRQPDAALQIETIPAGATVFLDDVNLGASPVAVFYKPGVYPIRIVKDGYVTIENQTLEVKLPQTRQSYTLEENVGYITINTHSGATVYFNDQLISDPENVKLPPQLVRIKVTMPKAETLEQQVVLRRNDRLTLDIYPDVQTATLQIAVTPFDAKIELTGDAGEKFSAEGMKIFENIPIGTYTIKVSATGHDPKQETLTLKTGERLNRSIRLIETRAAQPAVAATSDHGIEMVFVKGGTFTMGCTSEQGSDCDDDEKPTRRVTVGDFYIGKYEVTQKQWRAVMGSDPPELRFKGCDDCPVEHVSWNDIQEFIKKLNQKTGKKYRLPTEAEWEYAARGGAQSRGFKYAGSNNIDEVAWYSSNSGSKTRPVGGKKPNELGLYDMSGNVWEWCEDDWHGNYNGAPTYGRAWIDSPRGSHRVLRGGSWYYNAWFCRVSNRSRDFPDFWSSYDGFRLAQDF